MVNEILKLETPVYKAWQTGVDVFTFRFSEGAEITLDAARESVEASSRLSGDRDYCILVNIEGIKNIDRAARAFYTNATQGPLAVALVGASPVARVIGNMFLGLNKHGSLPHQMFSNEGDVQCYG